VELFRPNWLPEPHNRQGVERGSFGHSSTLHWPADGQFQLLKGAEEDQVVTEVIRAVSVVCILWGSPTRWTQVAGKEKLWASIPTVFQWIVVVLLNAVRIRRNNKDGVLHTTKL
jgi:hypothetical protein